VEQQSASQFEKLNVKRAYQAVSQAIEDGILNGKFKPGHQLPSEFDLASQFGVNRSTVREGLRLLEQNGLVAREAGKRLHITLPRYRDLSSRMTRAMIMHQITFRELWEVAIVLEPAAAAAAALSNDPIMIETLENNLHKTRQTLDSGDSILALDLEFHKLIAEFTNNRALVLAREPVGMLLLPAFEAVLPMLPKAGERLLEAHGIILDALRTNNADRAATWMRKHIEDLKRGYEVAGINIDRPINKEPPVNTGSDLGSC
jgi:GntR family transcriptional repressor for pyruvate dehydrogenase complex